LFGLLKTTLQVFKPWRKTPIINIKLN